MPRNRWTRHRPLFSDPVSRDVRRGRIQWRVLPIAWLAIKKTCTVIGAFVLVTVLLSILMLSGLNETTAPPLPQKMALYLEFSDGFYEKPSGSALAGSFNLEPPTVHQVVDAIDLAAKDERVMGIMARMDGGTFSTAQTKEVRDALARFRASGKFTRIYSASYGEAGGGLGRFYLASAFAERWMQPLGIVSIPGVAAEMPFFRGTLDKIGVEPQFFQRKEYKTAYENLTAKKMSPQNRETLEHIVGDLRAVLTRDIAADLQISPVKFEALVNKGLFTGPEALQEKLVTELNYVDVLVSRISEELTGDSESEEEFFVDPKAYLAALGREQSESNLVRGHFSDARSRVALVHVAGAIMDTRIGVTSAPSGFADEGIAAADEIAPAILDAAEDESIEAIVVRVDSPGGSPVASETILRAIDRAREKGKPVIVSMGSTAASGGYWVAAHADRIFATPTTITGSIGVVGGKFSAKDVWPKLGVNWERVEWGRNAGLWSINTPFSESEAERINAMLDQVYDAFLKRVSSGRKMSVEQVDKIAGGRVWSGEAAKRVGLVDEIGGLQNALDYTATLLKAEDRFGLDIVILPKPLTTFEELLAFLSEQGAVYEGLKFQAMLGRVSKPFMDQMDVISQPNFTTYEPLRVQ
ncbi:MAG TPA: signal peptide peptidase SppA [Alphaproteobacteria bacterium]|nr:signal peptide peptidase SppA [Micavibrio sp.]HQX28136.1 signal peptide peptidase SppA [Alphaproteobacteria bacterium]